MKINTAKCGILVWEGCEPILNKTNMTIKTCFGEIDEVKSYKYLGVTIQKHLMEEEIVRSAGIKGSMILNAMKSSFLNKNLSLYLKNILVKNVMLPTMLYGNELWGMPSARAHVVNTKVRQAYILMFGSKNVAYDSVSEEFRVERKRQKQLRQE
jgi:hypothetical protein